MIKAFTLGLIMAVLMAGRAENPSRTSENAPNRVIREKEG